MAESAGIPSTTNNNKPIGQSTLDLTNFSLPPISTPATPAAQTPIKNTTIDLNSFSLPVVTKPITPTAQTPIKNTTIDLNSFSLPVVTKPTTPVTPTATTPVAPAAQTAAKDTTIDLNSFSLPVATKPATPVTPAPATPTAAKDTKNNLGGFSFSWFIKKAIQSVVKPATPTVPTETKSTVPTPETPSLQVPTNSTPIAAKNPAPQAKPTLDLTKIPNNNDLNLGSLNITTKVESKDDKLKTNALLASGVREEPKKEKKWFALSNVQIIVAGYAIILITILGSIGVQMYSNYISLQNQVPKDETKASFIENGQNIELFISKYTQINDFALRADQTSLLTTNPEKDTIANSIKNDTKLNFTQKRIVLQNNINWLNTDIVDNNRKLEETKLEIEKYGFIPKELYDMTQKEEWINNIRRSMLLKENIKFITAFKVFGYMQSFVQWFANDSSIDAKKIEEQLKSLNENWEKDIITYTNNCYFNPYEIGDDCGITKEFDTYYKIINTKSNVDPDFIKKIASYADRKLNEKELPNYTITFPEFNPKQEEIKFTTDINTNRQDELALNKIGIINPHLYIITNLLNTLKQSLLVIGEDIKVDQIKISPKTVRIGSTIFTINNSTLNFNLPIQKPDQREISDFFSNQSSN
jgi:hypothetical protein